MQSNEPTAIGNNNNYADVSVLHSIAANAQLPSSTSLPIAAAAAGTNYADASALRPDACDDGNNYASVSAVRAAAASGAASEYEVGPLMVRWSEYAVIVVQWSMLRLRCDMRLTDQREHELRQSECADAQRVLE